MNHTPATAPTPWTLDPEGEYAATIEDAAGNPIADVYGPASNNPIAAHSVKCVNHHDELVYLAKRVECFLDALHDDAAEIFGGADKEPVSVVGIRDFARSILAKLEGGAGPSGACILTAENMHTAEDCTLHEHEDGGDR